MMVSAASVCPRVEPPVTVAAATATAASSWDPGANFPEPVTVPFPRTLRPTAIVVVAVLLGGLLTACSSQPDVERPIRVEKPVRPDKIERPVRRN